jgi:amino acid adenylation domain-containing protein
MTVLAAWNGLLARFTGQSDFAVGTPVAGRQRAATQGLIGFFVNTLVLRADLSGRPGFTELLERVRETALGAYAHQDVPFERLLEELAVERSLEHTPLFQVMAIVQQSMSDGVSGVNLSFPGLRLTPMDYENRTAKFDLTLLFDPNPEAPRATLGFNTDLFRPDTIVRLLGSLEALLTEVIADPERPLVDLVLLSAAERHQLLVAWNDTPGTVAAPDAEACLHQLFEGWAAKRPGAVAAVLDGELLTYGTLDRRAGLLAAHLCALGVGPEVRVGLCLPRSFDLLVALLAVLKAGGAYVPLDPANPRDRLLFLVADSRVPVLLTVESQAADLGEPVADSGTTVICLDASSAFPLGGEIARPTPSPGVLADNLAYVIYTSGSTGTPNGVLVAHRGAVHLIREAADLYQITPESRVLQTASVGFDASVLEIFLALGHGASLCLVREEERLTPAVFADRLGEQKVTTAVVTPSLLSVLPADRLGQLRSISVGGEACPPELAARWAPGRRFLNCYGPTEATIFATVAILSGSEKITIGRPIGNVQAYVVDRELQPAALGAVGELVIGGVGLARGYLDRPEKTAMRFVPDPFSCHSGARLYRTSDLARFTPAGELEFLGRLDDQVKVRGFRIELGEIESVLLRHPGLQAAVALAPADAQGDRRLVAYVAGPAAGRPSEDELRVFLLVHLPEYMVPSRLVLLDVLPTTPGGKLDRRALPDPDGARQETRDRVAPRTVSEHFVAGLWREVLGVREIGVEDDFFALGGNSIKGAILTNLLQEKLGEYVYVVALFDAPTLEALARYLEENYTEAMKRVTGERVSGVSRQEDRVDAGMIATLRQIIAPLAPHSSPAARNPRNRRAVFLLSPPRSGSTLLRVLLAGNPALFAPPELELLGFNSLTERQEALSGRWALWQEGTLRALMDVYSSDVAEARQRMDEAVGRQLSVREFYAQLQAALGDRLLVDKTPSYALDPATLARAEEDFEVPLYIHLLRHPFGMIRSFEKAKLDQVFFRPSHPFSRRQLAELIWDVSQENILDHLAGIPAERQIQLRFEEMVKEPEREMRRVCEFLGIPFAAGMLDPYAEKAQRMTDGIHQLSKMVGDVKFHEHAAIDPTVAESWKGEIGEDFLGEVTWRRAETLGYPRLSQPPSALPSPRTARSPLVALVPPAEAGSGRPFFLIHPAGGDVFCYSGLARELSPDRPVYGLAAPPLAAEDRTSELEERAAVYVEALIFAQPRGPYAVGGWSLGGIFAWEVAQQLLRRGAEVELLVLLDTRAPSPSAPRLDQADLLASLAEELATVSGQPLSITAADLREIPEAERLRTVLAAAREAGAIPAGVGEESARDHLRVLEANIAAAQAYRPQPYPGRVLLVSAARHGEAASSLGWGALAVSGLEVVPLATDHLRLLSEPDLAPLLREKLAGGLLG